ncbi:hypothetical protein KEJ26_02620 [Candidatus Bathyarchaeota archaeon]|nr:hypothetical protein [Candidatus Bathyarchaeota archaeon]
MGQIIVKAEAKVNPTEDEEKVKKAIQNIILNPSFEIVQMNYEKLVVATSHEKDCLAKLYNLFRQERILDAARRALFEGMSGNTITFYLNKQVAYVGHVSFCEPSAESPLGPIRVEIVCEDPRELINWIAPKTVEGRLVSK